MMHTLTLS